MDPERFAVVREALAKEYANVRFGQPYQWALYRLDVSPGAEPAAGAQGHSVAGLRGGREARCRCLQLCHRFSATAAARVHLPFPLPTPTLSNTHV